MKDQKQILRESYIKQKISLPEETVTLYSEMICNRLIQTLPFQEARCIALYCAIDNEVSTYELMEKWRTEKQIVLPVVSGNNIHFYPYTGKDNLKKGAFGILEPVSHELVQPENIDLFIVPGVAFDYACNRLGRGKGYYDRYLSDIKKPIIGLCFDFQLIDSIPHETHDKKMTIVITENATTYLYGVVIR